MNHTSRLRPESHTGHAVATPNAPARSAALILQSILLVVGFMLFLLLAAPLLLLLFFVTVCESLSVVRSDGGLYLEGYRAVSDLTMVFLRLLAPAPETDYALDLSREDAPRLHRLIREIADAVGTAPPDRVQLEMMNNASVRLRGYRRAAGRTTLRLGYDLLASLTEPQFASVLAHEMAHAKCVQRGYKGLLAASVRRMDRLRCGLDEFLEEFEGGSRTQHRPARLLLQIARFFTRHGSRLLGARSRQDEFEADRLAAQACGAEMTRDALMRTHVSDYKGQNLAQRDRILQMERPGSYASWLTQRLRPEDDAERAKLEAKALEESAHDDYSSHPALADRLAALGTETSYAAAPAIGGDSAVQLLDSPDDWARRLIARLEQAEANAQDEDSRSVLKQLRRQKFRSQSASMCILGVVCVLMFGGFSLAFWIGGGAFAQSRDLFSIALMGGFTLLGVYLIVASTRRTFAEIPLPRFADWRAAQEAEDAKLDGGWQQALESQLRAGEPAGGAKARKEYWRDQCRQSLAAADCPRAWVAGRIYGGLSSGACEALLAQGIGAVYFGQQSMVRDALFKAFSKFGLGASISWAMGWGIYQLGGVRDAEPFLLDAAARHPQSATVWAVLGRAQHRRGKLHCALDAARKAHQYEPDEPRHSLFLAQVLLDLGRLSAAKESLARAAALRGDLEARGIALTIALLEGDCDGAQAQSIAIQEIDPGWRTLWKLSGWHDDAGDSAGSRAILEKLSALGFRPEALLAMAALDARAGSADAARVRIGLALNLTRPLAEGARGPIAMLQAAMRLRNTLETPRPGCGAWTASLDIAANPGPEKRLQLLIVAENLDAAKAIAAGLYSTLFPGQQWDERKSTWRPSEEKNQPSGPSAPGIHGSRVF
ncbi:M48 family metalloprotease [Capsulimonas corticalis]|uniref:M48 family metalloprotease n=1 Tax=Capsulimonas corticalis TaxID=2219043 RepID=UPI001403471F|nr:M48 family metalloprotease [Capsulimonas corticalis]